MGTIFNIQKFCLHDGDGIRTTVFFKGCPLACAWCHNPEGLNKAQSLMFTQAKCTLCGACLKECQAREIKDKKIIINRKICQKCGKCTLVCKFDANEILGKEVTAQEVINEVLKDKAFYKKSGGGLTLSGGEPSMQPEFALELISLAKKENVSASIETCGYGDADFFLSANKLGCTFLFDIKCINGQRHKELTGVDNKRILDNLNLLFKNNADVIIRLPLIPNVNDTDACLKELCGFFVLNIDIDIKL